MNNGTGVFDTMNGIWIKRFFFLAKSAAVILILCLAFFFVRTQPTPGYGYSQEYLPGTGNIKGSVDTAYFESLGQDFEIGANRDGYAVFKKPRAVMIAIHRDYKPGLSVMMENGLYYPVLGIQVKGCTSGLAMDLKGSSTEGLKQAKQICRMMDIYENSFRWGRY